LKLISLGTSGGAPTKRRNCSACVLQDENFSVLFDCGEGTQRQMLFAGLKLSKIKYIFITHLHSDHLAGLVPLLSTKSMFNIAGDIIIVGPPGIKEYINFNLNITQSHLNYGYEIREISGNQSVVFPEFKLEMLEMNHRIFCLSFRLLFPVHKGNIKNEKLESFGLKEGKVCGQLKRGETVELSDGRKVVLADVATPDIPGKIFTYAGDTYLCDNLLKAADNADYLYIEATFQNDHLDRAKDRNHLTSGLCGQVAEKSAVKNLILSHFSAAYTEMNIFMEEAKAEFHGFVHLARDLKVFDLEHLNKEIVADEL